MLRRLSAPSAFYLLTGLFMGCSDRGLPTTPAAADTRALLSSGKDGDRTRTRRFVSLGTGCESRILSSEVVDGLLVLRLENLNIEASDEKRFAGWATLRPVLTIDLATNTLLAISGTGEHRPNGVNGTWSVTIDRSVIKDGQLLRAFVSGVGTGELAGLGIRYRVIINVEGEAARPNPACPSGQPYLTVGKIFRLRGDGSDDNDSDAME